ncbi:hypothetical protein E6H23_04335 [Candidatus Bathyarchaeota archaeon]|nr:MAG: hypothetical protein E6H23_04335 [Candidatus Bathyarchaeota archaeon]
MVEGRSLPAMKWSLTDMGIYEIAGGGRYGRGPQNRVGKTFLMALGAWDAEEAGMDVFANCPTNPKTGELDHILNMPHICYDPYDLIQEDLYDVYVMTDQAEQVMDARACQKKDIRNLGYFNYQAKKRGIAWRYDTPRHKNIDPRIRLNPDAYIYPERIPRNWREPLKAIRLILDMNGRFYFLKIRNPQDYFPIYNEKVMLRPQERNT